MSIDRRSCRQFSDVATRTTLDHHVRMTRSNIYLPRFNLLVTLRLKNMRRTETVQAAGERCGEGLWHMLHDEYGRTICRTPQHEVLDSFSTAGRSTDKNYFTVPPLPAPRSNDRLHGRHGSGNGNRSTQTCAFGCTNLLDKIFCIALHAPSAIGPWLPDEINGPELQSPQRGIRSGLSERGHHNHGHWPQAHQTLEKLQAVHFGHLDIQSQNIRIQRLDHLASRRSIRRGTDHLHIRSQADHLAEQATHQSGIIDNQNSNFLGHLVFNYECFDRTASKRLK